MKYVAKHRPDIAPPYSWIVFLGDTPVRGDEGHILAYTAQSHAMSAAEALNRQAA